MRWHERMGRQTRTIQQNAREVALIHAEWVIHALYCEACDVVALAHWLLDLAGLEVDELVDIQWRRLIEAVRRGAT